MLHGGRFSGGFECFENGFLEGDMHFIIGLVILVIISVVIIFFIGKGRKNKNINNILEILKIKYINGEITEEEYKKRKDVLSKT
jgi:putative membrane protein